MRQEGGDNCEYQLVVGCTHEALDKCVTCTKNEELQTHEDFTPFSKLDVKDLPEECRTNQVVVDVICDLALLTVQLEVNYISIHRPLDGFGVDPNLRGKRAIIKGSGSMIAVKEKTLTTRKTQCPRVCSALDGDQFCGYFVVATAAHVVFDDDEAANTSVVFFFHDSQKRKLTEKCHGVRVQTTSKEGDFTEMLCVTHNRQFFNHLYKHVENMSDVSKKVPDTYDIEVRFLLQYTYEQTVENRMRRPDNLAFPSEFPTGIWYTFDNSLFCFPKSEQAKSVFQNLALGRCTVTADDQGVKVEENPDLINKSQLSGSCKTTEMFLLSLNDSFLIMCTEKYLHYIIWICSEIFMYKETFTADWKDDGSVQLCRKTKSFPPSDHMKVFYCYEWYSSTWLRVNVSGKYREPWIGDYIFLQISLGGRTFLTTERLVSEREIIEKSMSDGLKRKSQIIGMLMAEKEREELGVMRDRSEREREIEPLMRDRPMRERKMLEEVTNEILKGDKEKFMIMIRQKKKLKRQAVQTKLSEELGTEIEMLEGKLKQREMAGKLIKERLMSYKQDRLERENLMRDRLTIQINKRQNNEKQTDLRQTDERQTSYRHKRQTDERQTSYRHERQTDERQTHGTQTGEKETDHIAFEDKHIDEEKISHFTTLTYHVEVIEMLNTLKEHSEIWSKHEPEAMIGNMTTALYHYHSKLLKSDFVDSKKSIPSCSLLLKQLEPKVAISEQLNFLSAEGLELANRCLHYSWDTKLVLLISYLWDRIDDKLTFLPFYCDFLSEVWEESEKVLKHLMRLDDARLSDSLYDKRLKYWKLHGTPEILRYLRISSHRLSQLWIELKIDVNKTSPFVTDLKRAGLYPEIRISHHTDPIRKFTLTQFANEFNLYLGTSLLVDKDPASEQEMLVVHISHPHGQSKHISLGSTSEIETDSGFYRQVYQVATCPGSSGGPVWFIPTEILQRLFNKSDITARLTGVPHSRHLGNNMNCSGSWSLYCPRIDKDEDDISDS